MMNMFEGMKSSIPIVGVVEGATGSDIGFLDYAYAEGEPIIAEAPSFAAFSNAEQIGKDGGLFYHAKVDREGGLRPMGLKLDKQKITFAREFIKVDPADDYVAKVRESIMRDVVSAIKESASRSKKIQLDKGVELDLVMSEYENWYARQRKLMSKVIAASTLVTNTARRGPAQWVIANENTIKLLARDTDDRSDYIYKYDAPGTKHIAGMTMYVCDALKDTVLLGRTPDSSPGIYFVSNDIDILKLSVDKIDISEVESSYYVGPVGKSADHGYISFECVGL